MFGYIHKRKTKLIFLLAKSTEFARKDSFIWHFMLRKEVTN